MQAQANNVVPVEFDMCVMSQARGQKGLALAEFLLNGRKATSKTSFFGLLGM